jgi:hypothetical protein
MFEYNVAKQLNCRNRNYYKKMDNLTLAIVYSPYVE